MANSTTTVLLVLLIVCNVPAVLDNSLSEEKSADNFTTVLFGTCATKDNDVSTKPEQAQPASCILENIHAETIGNLLPKRVAGNDTGRRRPAFSNDLIAEIQFDFTKGLQDHVTINLNKDRIFDIILSPPSQTSAPRKTTLPESVQNSRLWDILSSHLHTIYLHSVQGQVTLSVQLHLDSWVALVHSRLTEDGHEPIQVAEHGQNFFIPFNRTVHDSDTNTTDPLEMSNSNDFPSFPRRPSGPNVFQESTPAKYSSVDHSPTRSATLPETSHSSSKGQVLFNAIGVICLLLKFLQWIRPESLAEKEKHQRNGTYISILTHLFFLNWHWSRTQHSKNASVDAGQIQETSEEGKRTWTQNMDSSEKNVLKQIIFRPWLSSVFTGNGSVKSETNSKPHLKKPKDTHTGEDAGGCRSFASKICSACQRRLDEFRSISQKTSERQQGKESHENVQESPLHPHVCKDAEHLESHHCHQQQKHHGDHLHHQQQFIIVNPASRYLPDPTCDPAIDLVHVGYRLATLSALSAAMPISRIRLADAGFYFGGRGDEVTCYSCGRSHAGWARGDNPMEVHRRLHPDCEHVLQVDRLTQALNSNQNSENVGDGRGGPVSNTENRAAPVTAAAGSNPPAEDGEESGTSSRRRTDQRRQTPERNASHRPPPSPANTERRPQTPQTTLSIPPASRISPSAQETERTASSTATTTQRIATNSLPPTQPSTNESARNATSANQSQPTESNASRQNQSATSNVNPAADANARAATTLHGQASGAESNPEARPLFPRAGLDLSGAVYPMYQDMQSRRRTFTTWNERTAPSLDHIIMSGMFYAGYADCVRCFYCGVGLKHWVATDDVMTEHVRWRPGCEYLRTIKGDDFIRDVQQRLALQTSGSTGTNIGDSGNATPRATTTAAAATTNSSSPSPSSTSAATSAPVSSAATSASVRSATAAVASVTTTTTSASSSPSSSSPTTATTTSNASSSSSLSANTLSAPSSTTSTSNNRPEASSAAVTTTTSQATATTSSSSSARGDGATPSTTGHTSGSTSAVSSAAEDSETLDQLQAENRALEERFRCRVCHQGTINTILMPCGHLVACEDCARSVTSCPLCHDPIRATARVYLA